MKDYEYSCNNHKKIEMNLVHKFVNLKEKLFKVVHLSVRFVKFVHRLLFLVVKVLGVGGDRL